MKQPSNRLTDEDFAALLTHANPNEQIAEVTAVQTALQSYRAETLQWAERRSSTQASLLPTARRSERWAALPQWSMAMVAAVTIAGGVAHLAGSRAVVQDTSTTSGPVEAQVQSSDVAADNQLLTSIDAALSYQTAPPVEALPLKQSDRSISRHEASNVTD